MTRIEELETMLGKIIELKGNEDDFEKSLWDEARKVLKGSMVKCPCGCQWTSDTEDDLQYHLKTAHSRFEIQDALRDGHLVVIETDSLYHLPK